MTSAQFLDSLGDYGFADTGLNRKIEKIQAAVWDIESRKPWPFLEASMLLNYAGGSDTASNAPTDLRQALRVRDMTTGRRLNPMRLDDADDAIGTELTLAGDPLFYYFEAGQLKVWPLPPAATGRLKLRYIKRSAAISDSSPEAAYLIPAQHHEAILFGALVRLYDMEDDVELAVRFQGLYEKRIAEMVDDVFKQQYDQPDYIRVFDPDDWDDENF
jgi:hypothetical protein